MAAKRRTMADLLNEATTIESPFDGDPRPGTEPSEPTPAPVVPARVAAAIPEPPRSAGDGPLSADELSDLSVCEAAVAGLTQAFWAAGKALQTVRDGRLYRDRYATFEDYVEERWDMRRAYADKLIRAWPLAEHLDPIGSRDLNEAQVRELLPVARQHGQDAAATVYETVVEVDGVKVTAAVLHKVVGILPDDGFDRDEAVAQIRAYLAGELIVREIPSADPVQAFKAFTARATKLVTDLQGIAAGGDAIKRARTADPGVVDQVAAALRAMADEIERA